MSCWVAVSVAGEYLGVSSAELMQRVETGTLSSRFELGMLMVDVKPEANPFERRRHPRPAMTIPQRPLHESEIERVVEQIDDPSGIEHDRFSDWRIARAQTSRVRRAPLAA